MGVATYKTADEMDPELLKALPPKEEMQRVFKERTESTGTVLCDYNYVNILSV